jgi:hypothetical protein
LVFFPFGSAIRNDYGADLGDITKILGYSEKKAGERRRHMHRDMDAIRIKNENEEAK